MPMLVSSLCLMFALVAGPTPRGPIDPAPAPIGIDGATKLDKKNLEKFAARWWKARPKTKFESFDPAVRADLLTEADQLGELPPGKMDELIDLLWKQLRKEPPGSSKRVFQTPFGEATWLEKGKGKGKGLVIGLHGGGEGAGSASEATRWTAKECVGIYPQGIQLVHDTWNTVHGERFLLTLIEYAKVQHDVDPDRVYSMGFSMGGTGSWFMAGRHTDLLAASSPNAGVIMAEPKAQLKTKEEVVAIQHGFVPNVRNLPMYYYIGLEDTNTMPGTYLYIWDRLQELRAADQGGYDQIIFKTYEGLAHSFPPGEPQTGIEWMGKQTRDPYPTKIVWEYASNPFPQAAADSPLPRLPKDRFYWLYCSDPKDRMYVVATRSGNEFDLSVQRADPKSFSIYMNPEMIDENEDVIVRVDGDEVYRGRPRSSIRNVVETLDANLDRRLTFDRRADLH